MVNRDENTPTKPPPTFADALVAYEFDLGSRGANPSNARQPRPHLTATLLSKPLPLITADDLTRWRDAVVAKGVRPVTVNRIWNCLRAAVALVAPACSPVWKEGLKSFPDAQSARNVILTDAQVLALVAAAYRHDAGLGLLVDVLATTGARPSQAVRLVVEDLHAELLPKLDMPASGKGGRNRAEKKSRRVPVPITPGLARKLKAGATGRRPDAPLLLRSNGRPWNLARPYTDYRLDIPAVIAQCGHDPDVVTAYALRHSSIVRQLLRGVPIRVVAATHDTSVAQIEKHYSAHITDHSDKLTRAALLEDPAPAGRVVPLGRR